MSEASKAIRIGIIGTGLIGKAHIENYQKIPAAKIVAVADLNEAEARRVAEKHTIPNVYSDYKELLKRDDIDAVDVCLHNGLHAPATVAGLKAGKDVYCEKPMADTYASAKLMYDTAQALGRKLSIQLGTLYSMETRTAKAMIDAGRLGELYHARSTGFRRRGRPYVDGYATPAFVQKRTAGGGALYDMGVYHIAVMLYLLGNPKVERITGKAYQKMGMDSRRRKASNYDVEEMGLGFVRFEKDITLDIIEAWAMHLDNLEGSCVLGTEGGIRLHPFGYFRFQDDMELNCTINLDAVKYRWKAVDERGDSYDSSQHHWIAALQGLVPLLPTAEVALNTMLVSEGIYLSEKLGREVQASEVESQSKPIATNL